MAPAVVQHTKHFVSLLYRDRFVIACWTSQEQEEAINSDATGTQNDLVRVLPFAAHVLGTKAVLE